MVTTADISGTLPSDQDKILPSLMAHFSEASEDRPNALDILTKIQSGSYNSLAAYSSMRDDDGSTYGSFEETEKIQKKKMLATVIAQEQVFSFGGINLNINSIFENINHVAEDINKKIEANKKAMELREMDIARDGRGHQIMTPEALKAFEAQHGFCHGRHMFTASEIVMVDGKPVIAGLYAEYTQKNEALETEQQRVSQYSVQLKNGNITFDQLPTDLKQDIVDVEKAKTAAPAPAPTVLEQLQTNDPVKLNADLSQPAPQTLIPTLDLKPTI